MLPWSVRKLTAKLSTGPDVRLVTVAIMQWITIE